MPLLSRFQATLPALAVAALVSLVATPISAQAQTTYVGKDAGATSLATSPNSVAAAAAFDAAVPGTTVLTFEPGTATQVISGATATVTSGGVTFTLTNQNPSFAPLNSVYQGPGIGFNTTVGGTTNLFSASQDFNQPRSLTVTFSTAVDAFGAYFGGMGDIPGLVSLTYIDGTARSFNLTNLVGNGSGGNGFFGVSGGGSFNSLTFSYTPPGTGSGDAFSIDDFRFRNAAVAPTAVPEPGEWAIMGMLGTSVCGLMVRARRKASTSKMVAATA